MITPPRLAASLDAICCAGPSVPKCQTQVRKGGPPQGGPDRGVGSGVGSGVGAGVGSGVGTVSGQGWARVWVRGSGRAWEKGWASACGAASGLAVGALWSAATPAFVRASAAKVAEIEDDRGDKGDAEEGSGHAEAVRAAVPDRSGGDADERRRCAAEPHVHPLLSKATSMAQPMAVGL